MGKFAPCSQVGWLNNLFSDSRDGKELDGAIKKHSLQKRPQPSTKIIFRADFF